MSRVSLVIFANDTGRALRSCDVPDDCAHLQAREGETAFIRQPDMAQLWRWRLVDGVPVIDPAAEPPEA